MFKKTTILKSSRADKLLLVAILAGVFFVLFISDAQTQNESQKKIQLESQIAQIEQEIAALDQDLSEVQARSRTLENEIFRFNTEIRRAELTIKGLNLSITRAENQIFEHQVSIDNTQDQIEKQHAALAEYLRIFYKHTDRSLVEIILSKDLSYFFREVDILEGLQEDAQLSLGQLRVLKAELETEKEALQEQRGEFAGLKALAEIEEQNLSVQKQEKGRILTITKGEEIKYQQIITEKQRNIAAIRSQIFYLEQTGITAEEAVKYAELATARTGIRTAFLLGLLEIETGRRFAEGVITAGSHLGTGNWREDMHPTRDQPIFEDITRRLGLDPDKMPVSAKPSYGWGGAMGPAQFIPSTWVLFEERVAKLTGHNPPNPWVVEDAFTAAALYLADAGATAKTRTAEIRAAKAYISGSPNCTKYICNFYANEVLRVANLIEHNL